MTTETLAVYLLLAILLPIAIALWARAWGRNPIVWGLIAFLLTPFLILVVVGALAVGGRRRSNGQEQSRS